MIDPRYLADGYVRVLTVPCEHCEARASAGSVARVEIAVPEIDGSVVLCECDAWDPSDDAGDDRRN